MLLTPTFVGLLLAGAHDRAIETPFLRAIVRSDPAPRDQDLSRVA